MVVTLKWATGRSIVHIVVRVIDSLHRWVCPGLCAVFLIAHAGCQWKGGDVGSEVNPGKGEAGAWVLRASGVRVYPSSRYALDGGQLVLMGRIEFTDEMGDAVKAVGRCRLELFKDESGDGQLLGTPLYHWEVSLVSLADQRLHYDSITRTYTFPLVLDDRRPPGSRTVLCVIFIGATGERLETQGSIAAWDG